MNASEQFLYLLAGMYHSMALFFASAAPWMAQQYETISQNIFALLRAAGVPV
jgi:hypothetical protein